MLHRKIFWLLLLLFPIQLGRHFWPDFAFVFGIRVDYLSPTVYLTDLVVVALLAAWAVETGGIRGLRGTRRIRVAPFLILLPLLVLLPSLLFAQNQGAAIYKSAKTIELVLLGVYIYSNSSWVLKTRMFSKPLSLSIIYTSAIAAVQIFKQAPLGGVFWFLGERTFTASTPGIALGNFFGQEFLRPYSIFSHPNVLAGFLLVSVLLLYPWRNYVEKVALGIGLVAIALSFSQGTWLAGGLLLLYCRLAKNKAVLAFLTGLMVGGIILATLLPVFVPPTISINFPEAVKMRHELSWTAGQMIKDNPIFGVGMNNFVNRLPEYGLSPTVSWWLQPAHNVWLLMGAEIGMVGLGVFMWLIYKSTARMDGGRWKLEGVTLALFAVLITGTFDHYWLTLQQTLLLLTIVFGLALSQPKSLVLGPSRDVN